MASPTASSKVRRFKRLKLFIKRCIAFSYREVVVGGCPYAYDEFRERPPTSIHCYVLFFTFSTAHVQVIIRLRAHKWGVASRCALNIHARVLSAGECLLCVSPLLRK